MQRLKKVSKRVLVALMRSQLGRHLVGFVVVNMSFAIPTEKLRQTSMLLAFYHPQPVYAVHILIVPRRPLPNLLALGARDVDFLLELVETTKSLVTELGLEAKGYRLITNGGAYQDLPYLHFHLVSGVLL